MEEIEKSLAKCIESFISARLVAKLETFDKAVEKNLQQVPVEERDELAGQLSDEREQLQEKHHPCVWLTDAAKRASQISMVTHAPKYTHSDTRSMGIFLCQEDKEVVSDQYLNSLSLAELTIDVVGNAAALDVAGLLSLQTSGTSLLDQIAAGDSPALQELATSEEQLQAWLAGFKLALQGKQPASGQLSKQIYFPLQKNQYHLLGPLYASSLSQFLYNRLTDNFYSDPAKAARKAKKLRNYHPDIAITYPDIAIQGHGGTKPQNISQLNTRRYGRSYLLSSLPPAWQKQPQPPKSKNSFWQEYDRRVWKTARFLQRYLENIFDRTNTKPRRDLRSELVDELIDTLLFYAAEVQNLKDISGWSQASELTRAEQLWLDPYRSDVDQEFKLERERNDWQADIAKQFAGWLNRKMSAKSERLFLGDPEFDNWKKLLERKLALLKEDLEVGT